MDAALSPAATGLEAIARRAAEHARHAVGETTRRAYEGNWADFAA
jgi:hypothetical protein